MNSKLLRNNLIGLVVYTIIIHLLFRTESQEEAGLGFLMVMMMLVGLHTAILVVIALFHFLGHRRPLGRSYLLSAVLVLTIGFGLCWGGAALTDAMSVRH